MNGLVDRPKDKCWALILNKLKNLESKGDKIFLIFPHKAPSSEFPLE
jgi:hypothetical protein